MFVTAIVALLTLQVTQQVYVQVCVHIEKEMPW